MLTVWLVSVGVIVVPQIEALLATKVHRLRLPSEWELRRLGPAWFAVCTAAGVDPDRYRVWVYEGPEATAPVVAGSTPAVSPEAMVRSASRLSLIRPARIGVRRGRSRRQVALWW